MKNIRAMDNRARPEQHESAQDDIVHVVNLVTEQKAKELYNEAKSRLLDVSHWDMWSSGISSKFFLTDESGREVLRPARQGDHFKINAPGPGSPSGEGYNWVRIEVIEEERYPDGQHETFFMKVSPAINPKEGESNTTAHFLSEKVTSTFRIDRIGRKVTVGVHGQPEQTVDTSDRTGESRQNNFTAFGSVFGFSRIQWRKLTKGLLEYKGL